MKPFVSKAFWKSVKVISLVSLRDSYRNSFLGIAWSMIQPTAYIVVLSVVFSTIWRMSTKDYFIYSASGMVAWQFMLGAITKSSSALISRRNVFHHALLPKSLFIISDLIVAAYVFFITLIALFAVLLVLGHFHIMSLLYLPFALIPMLLLCVGASFTLAYLSPYIGDIPHLTNLFFMVVFWTCPIAYPLEVIPAERRVYFEYNPFYLVVQPIQQALYRGEPPAILPYSLAIGFSLISCLIGYITYKKLRRGVIYYL